MRPVGGASSEPAEAHEGAAAPARTRAFLIAPDQARLGECSEVTPEHVEGCGAWVVALGRLLRTRRAVRAQMRPVIGNRPVVWGPTSQVALDARCSASASEQRKAARNRRVRDEILDRDGRSLPLSQVFVNTPDNGRCRDVSSATRLGERAGITPDERASPRVRPGGDASIRRWSRRDSLCLVSCDPRELGEHASELRPSARHP